MASEREIAFAKYWEGKERRPLTKQTAMNAYFAGWSDRPMANSPALPTPPINPPVSEGEK